MQMTRLKKSLSFIVCIVLIAAMALFATGCNDNNTDVESPASSGESESNITDDAITDSAESENNESEPESNVLGEGATKFTFTVTDTEGKETAYQINTDKKTVGEALMELKLIAGEESEYGLFVKMVDGITVDYDKDGKYWAFYVDGEYAMAGVDVTEITEGATYSFKAE